MQEISRKSRDAISRVPKCNYTYLISRSHVSLGIAQDIIAPGEISKQLATSSRSETVTD